MDKRCKMKCLIDEAPENTQANIQSWCWIAFCKHIVTRKGTFTEFETIQVFATQVNAECADAEIHVRCDFRQSHADGLRILVKKLTGKWRIILCFIRSEIAQFKPGANQQVFKSKISIITNLVPGEKKG